MRILVVSCNGYYYVAVRGIKRKSKIFYYKHVGYRGVEFVLSRSVAHTAYTESEAEDLAGYLIGRIKEVGFVLKPYIG